VKRSWSIASLTRGFFSLGSDTPPGDHPVTDRPHHPESGWKRLIALTLHNGARLAANECMRSGLWE
jgi:hypothetical protein